MNHQHGGHETPPSFWSSRFAIGLVVIGCVAAYFLLTEHLANVNEALPFLLLLACPMMHLMHGHGGHGGHGSHAQTPRRTNSDKE